MVVTISLRKWESLLETTGIAEYMSVIEREIGVDLFFFFNQKTAYEVLSGDWSSDVCSSDLPAAGVRRSGASGLHARPLAAGGRGPEIGRASLGKECRLTCRSRWSPYH